MNPLVSSSIITIIKIGFYHPQSICLLHARMSLDYYFDFPFAIVEISGILSMKKDCKSIFTINNDEDDLNTIMQINVT